MPPGYLKFQSRQERNSGGYPHVFEVKLFNGGVGDFVNRAVQLKIQDGGRKVGKTEMSLSWRLLQL